MRLGLDLLGGVRVLMDGVPVDVGGRRPRTLLAILALADGHRVSVDRLVDLIWEDDPPTTARRTLQSYVSGLRRVLGGDDGVLSASGAGYVLAIERSEVDLFVFADTVARAKDEIAVDPAGAAALLGAALESWAVPLDGVRPSLSLQAIVAPYEELRLEALETLNDVDLERGDAARAVGRLGTLVREHPVRERFWAQLVRGLATLGRRDAALHACQRARETLREHLGVQPSPLLQQLEREILDGGPLPLSPRAGLRPAARTIPPGNLVRPATEFIGRDAELLHVAAELAGRRLVTLTGAGGLGKTRLAIELAWSMVDEFSGGLWLAELAPVADPAAVVAAAASTLSIPLQGDMTMIESIVDWLKGRRLLLIVDNCEHVLTPVVDLVAAVVAGCPTVTVLATSREPLGVPGERVHLVRPLDPSSEGVELFCDRARAADASFVPNPDDRAVITAICERLDGIPLAIELAASRIRALSPPDLLAHLDERFGLLHGTGRGVSDRHQTMQATVEWSYQLLDERERGLIDRMSVFAGGFDLAAVEAVCADDTLDEVRIARVVGSLVDKSLIVADRSRRGVRFRLLEPMRQYGEGRLHERAATAQMRHRHLDHYVDVARRANQLWSSPRQVDADEIFDREWDNMRAAHAWAVTTANLAAADELVATTGPHAWCRMSHEHGDWSRRNLTLDRIGRRANATTYGWAAYWAYVGDDHDHSIEASRHGIDAALTPEHPDTNWCWAILLLNELASGCRSQAQEDSRRAPVAAASKSGYFVQWWLLSAFVEVAFITDLAAVPELVAKLASLSDKIGAPSLRARTAAYQGRQRMWAETPPDIEGSRACYRQGLELARDAGDVTTGNLNLIGIMYLETTLQSPTAADACKEAINRFRASRHWPVFWLSLGAVTSWWKAIGNLEPLAVVRGHVDAHHSPWSDTYVHRQELLTARQHPDADELMASGATMDRDQLVTFVLEQLDTAAE